MANEAVLRPGPDESWADWITRKLAGYDYDKPSPIRRKVAEGLPWAVGTIAPPVGALLSGNQAVHDASQGDYAGAGLNALGAVPVAGAAMSKALNAARAMREAAALKNYRYASASYPPGYGTHPNPPVKAQMTVRGTGEPAPADVVSHDPLGVLEGEGGLTADDIARNKALYEAKRAADEARGVDMMGEGGPDVISLADRRAQLAARKQERINRTPLVAQGSRDLATMPGTDLATQGSRALTPAEHNALSIARQMGMINENTVPRLGGPSTDIARGPRFVGEQFAGDSHGPWYSVSTNNSPSTGSMGPILGTGLLAAGGLGAASLYNDRGSDTGSANLHPDGGDVSTPAPAEAHLPQFASINPALTPDSSFPSLAPDTPAHTRLVKAHKEANKPQPQQPTVVHAPNPQREDLIRRAWEKYNQSESPADFVMASNLMKGDNRVPVTLPDNTQSMNPDGYAAGGKVGKKDKKSKSSSGGADGQKKEDCVYKALEVIHHMLIHGHRS